MKKRKPLTTITPEEKAFFKKLGREWKRHGVLITFRTGKRSAGAWKADGLFYPVQSEKAKVTTRNALVLDEKAKSREVTPEEERLLRAQGFVEVARFYPDGDPVGVPVLGR